METILDTGVVILRLIPLILAFFIPALFGMATWDISVTATAEASNLPNTAIGVMPLLFNAEAFPGAICDESVGGCVAEVYQLPGVGNEDVPQDATQFNWTVFCAGDSGMTAVARQVAGLPRGAASGPLLADLVLLAPVPRPGKIVAVGRNYADHAKEIGVDPFEKPRIIAKLPSSVVGPGAIVPRPIVCANELSQ